MAKTVLAARLRLLGIDDTTLHNMRQIRPLLLRELEAIVEELYRHLLSFPEVARLLPEKDIRVLKVKQKAHWTALFECNFDDHFAEYAMRVGQVHFDRKIPPYVYLAAYNYVQCLIVARISKAVNGRDDLAGALSSLSRVITLDIDLALSAYTRAYWNDKPHDEGGRILV